jgi:hypothetical protein
MIEWAFPLNYTTMDIFSLVLPLSLYKVVKILMDTNKMFRRKSIHYYFQDVVDCYMLDLLKFFYLLQLGFQITKIFPHVKSL